MKNKFVEIIKIAKDNKLISNNLTSAFKNKFSSIFYVTGNQVLDENKIKLYQVNLEKNYHEVNIQVKNKINNISYHGKKMVENYDKDYIIFQYIAPNKNDLVETIESQNIEDLRNKLNDLITK